MESNKEPKMIIEECEESKAKCDIHKLSSKYILKQIFELLYETKYFNIIRYNKNFRKILNINIQDYKELSQIKSPIEIEIIPAENKWGKVFNYLDEKYKSYYHIYLNNNNEEEEDNYLAEEKEVSKIKLVIEPNIVSFNKLFEDCKCIEYIYFKKFTRINIEDMRCMFWQCSSLKEINLTKFITDNVTNMSWMFYRCALLKKINISHCNINKVEGMVGMFWGCSSLEEVNLPLFKDDNQINMKCMFTECSQGLKNKIKNDNNKIKAEAFE